MTVKEMIELNKTDLIEVRCNDYRRCLPVSRQFFIETRKGTDIWNEVAKKYTIEEYDGNNDHETILIITL